MMSQRFQREDGLKRFPVPLHSFGMIPPIFCVKNSASVSEIAALSAEVPHPL